jgi:hypothetical protein
MTYNLIKIIDMNRLLYYYLKLVKIIEITLSYFYFFPFFILINHKKNLFYKNLNEYYLKIVL